MFLIPENSPSLNDNNNPATITIIGITVDSSPTDIPAIMLVAGPCLLALN
jgi:hypothetical protein